MARQETQDKDKIIRRVSVFILIAALLAYVFLNNTGETAEGLLTTGSNHLVVTDVLIKEHESGASVSAYGRGFFHITKDGISYISPTGQTQWSSVLNVTAPIYAAEGDIVAVSEYRSRNISVFNSKGEMYAKSLDNPIMSFSINKNGYLSVTTQNNEFYIVEVFNERGEWRSGANFRERNIFPIATDISDDNRYLAISLLNIGGVQMSSEVVMVHLGSEALDFTDGIFASSGIQEDCLIGVIKFMEGNNLIWASDKQINCAIIENNGGARFSHKWDLALSNKLDHISFNDGKSISLALGEPLINRDSVDIGTVYQYSLSKELLSSSKTGGRVTYLFSSMDATIIGNDRLFRAVNRNGGTIWSYNATRDVRQIVFFENTSRALLVANRDTSLMRAQRLRQEPIDIGEEIPHEIELIEDGHIDIEPNISYIEDDAYEDSSELEVGQDIEKVIDNPNNEEGLTAEDMETEPNSDAGEIMENSDNVQDAIP